MLGGGRGVFETSWGETLVALVVNEVEEGGAALQKSKTYSK